MTARVLLAACAVLISILWSGRPSDVNIGSDSLEVSNRQGCLSFLRFGFNAPLFGSLGLLFLLKTS